METEQHLQLIEWSKQAVKCYLEQVKQVGEDIATSFYNQSDLSRVNKCELMIIGINPGCGCRFSDWLLKDKISSDFLYKGNPCFKGMSDKDIIYEMSKKYDKDKRKYGWDLWNKIHKILNYTGKGELIENLDRFVLSNMVFFGTAHQGQIPKEINQEKCAEETLRLIDILKPKVVLLLGDQCKLLFNKVAKITYMEELVPRSHIFYCFYNNLHVIAVYHTAYYRYYTNYNMKIIGSIIGYSLDNSLRKIEKQKLESFLARTVKVESINRENEIKLKLKERIRILMQKINNNSSKQWIYNQDTLVHEFYTDINYNTGSYNKSNRAIVIDLYPMDDKEYWITIFTREYDKYLSGKIVKEALGDEYEECPYNPERHLYTRISMQESNENIVEIMNVLLNKIKEYRDKTYKKAINNM